MRGLTWIENWTQDFRYGLRMLSRNPGFTIVASFSLGLGIGATTTVFSVVNTVLLRPLPYPESDRLMLIQHRSLTPQLIPQPGRPRDFELTPASFLDLRRISKSFDRIAAFTSFDFTLTGAGEPERLTS
jgi:putative ABC transport system permease protein